MSVMSLTYRKAVRGLIREEQGGVKKNVHWNIYSESVPEATGN